jgi:L-xylulokinase
MRAVFEGVTFSHRTHIERLLAHREKPAELRLSGGIVSSPVWVKIFADCMQIPVKTVPVKNAGALGCAIAAAAAAGVYPDMKTASEHMTPRFETVLPDESKKAVYDAKYSRYMRAANALSGI